MFRIFLVSLLLILVLSINFYPIFFNNKTLTSDAGSTHVYDGGGPYWQIEPFLYLNHYYFLSRILPLWNLYNGTGFPLAAMTNTSSFSPFNILTFLYPSQLTMDVSVLFRVFLAGLFFYFFLRLWGITRLSSFIGAILFMLSSHNIWCILQFQMHTVAVMPAILFFLERVIRYKRKIDIFLSIIFISLAILGGNPQEIILVMILSSSYYFYRAISLREVFSMYLKGIYIFLIVFGLTAFFSVPAIEFFIHSEIAPRTYTQDIYYSFTRILYPYNKVYDFLPVWVVILMNIVISFLILIGLILGSRLESSKLRFFFLIYSIVFLCFLYEVPIFDRFGKLPILSHIVWAKYRATLYLAIGVLSSIGLDVIGRKNIIKKSIYFTTFSIVLIAIYFQTPRTYGWRTKELLQSPGVGYLKERLSKDNYRVLPRGIRHILEPNRNCIYRIPVLGYSGALHEKRYYNFVKSIFGNPPEQHPEKAVFENSRFLSLLGVKYLYSNRGPLLFGDRDKLLFERLRFESSRDIQSRFFSLGNRIKKGFLLYNDEKALLKINIEKDTILKFCVSPDPYYIETGYPEGIIFFIDLVTNEKMYPLFRKHLDPTNNPRHRKWHCYAIELSRYKGNEIELIFRIKAENPGIWANMMFVDKIDSKVDVQNKDWRMVFCDDVNGDIVYENKDVFNRAYIVHRTEVVDKNNVLTVLNNPDFDLGHKILIEKDIPLETLNCKGALLTDNSTASILEYTPNRIQIRANMENDGFLVLSDTYYPGWKAYVDGKEQEILAANYLFRALYLEKGNHNVEFKYVPLTFRLGSSISIIMIVLLVIYLAVSPHSNPLPRGRGKGEGSIL